MASSRRTAILRPFNNVRNQGSAASYMSYKELIRIIGVDPDLGPSSWRRAIDHSADTIVFFQVDLRASIPCMYKSVRICRETNGRLLHPSVYIGDTLLSSSYVKAVIGRAYLTDEDDLMKLLEHVGVLENGEEISDQAQDPHAFLPESIDEDLENASPYSLHPRDVGTAYPPPKRIKRTAGGNQRQASQEQHNRNPENTAGCSRVGNGEASALTNLFILTTTPIDDAKTTRTSTRAVKKRNRSEPGHVDELTEATAENSEDNAASDDRFSEADEEDRSTAKTAFDFMQGHVQGAVDRHDGDWEESQETHLIDTPASEKQRKASFSEEQHRFIVTERLKFNDSFTNVNANERKALWEDMTERMKERWPAMDQTYVQVHKRFENSFTKYRSLKRKPWGPGLGKPPNQWPYFRLFDAVMRNAATSKPQRDIYSLEKSARDGRTSINPLPTEDIYDEDEPVLDKED